MAAPLLVLMVQIFLLLVRYLCNCEAALLAPSRRYSQVFLYRDAVDFRKQSNGLADIAELGLGHNPLDDGLDANIPEKTWDKGCLTFMKVVKM